MDQAPEVVLPPTSPPLSTPHPRRIHPALFRPEAILLLSALLLFAGCYLVNGAAHQRQDELAPVLALLGLFNLYEYTVLLVAAYLSVRITGPAARVLCGISALLMVDFTFIYNELAIAHLPLGTTAVGFAVVTGLGKTLAITRIVGFRLKPAEWAALTLGLLGTFGLPVLLRTASGTTGKWPADLATSVWWITAAILTVAALMLTAPDPHSEPDRRPALGRHLRRALVLLPALSTAVHLLGAHWVYHQTLSAGHLAPVLLGFALVILHRTPPGDKRRQAAVIATTAAVIASMTHPAVWLGDENNLLAFSQWRAILLVAALGHFLLWHRQRTLGLLVAAPAFLLAALPGATPQAAVERLVYRSDAGIDAVRESAPSSPVAWGFVLIAAAFVTLAIGAWWARWHPASTDPE